MGVYITNVCICVSVYECMLPQNSPKLHVSPQIKKLNETLEQKEKLYPYVNLFSSMAHEVKKKTEKTKLEMAT